jgi:uncharacterized protein
MGHHKEEGNYQGGLMHGDWKFTYDNGKLYFEGKFIDGEPDGRHRHYWENGRIKEEGKYIMGKKEGEWRFYTNEGTLYLITYFKDGIELKYDGVKIKPMLVEQ